MKKFLASAALAATVAISAPFTLSGTALAAPVAYAIDPAHASVAFIVNHLGFSNLIGRFDKVAGDISFDKDDVGASAVTVTIDTASVDTNHEKRDEHLRSPDFFNAKEFPAMTFKSVKITKTGANTGEMVGDLTLLGVTKPVTLAVTFNKDGVSPASKKETAGFSAQGTVTRSAFGMKYGTPYISDEIKLLIEIEAIKK